MKNVFLKTSFLFTFILLISNNGFAQSTKYFQENIAITNIENIKNSDTNSFHYVLTLQDFTGRNNLPEGFGMNGQTFMDNGKFNDVKAGDGLFTAMEPMGPGIFKENPPIYDVAFKHVDKLTRSSSQKSTSSGVVAPGIKLKPCGCPCPDGGTCPACEWWGWDCWEIVEIEIPFPWED